MKKFVYKCDLCGLELPEKTQELAKWFGFDIVNAIPTLTGITKAGWHLCDNCANGIVKIVTELET